MDIRHERYTFAYEATKTLGFLLRDALVTIKSNTIITETEKNTLKEAADNALLSARQAGYELATDKARDLHTFIHEMFTHMEISHAIKNNVIRATTMITDLVNIWEHALQDIAQEKEIEEQRRAALSHSLTKATNAKKMIGKAKDAFIKIPLIAQSAAQSAIQKAAQKEIDNASHASWDALLAAQHTYERGNHAPMTMEKQAAQKTHTLQTFMSDITMNMKRFIDSKEIHNKQRLKNAIDEKLLQAEGQATNATTRWEQLQKRGGSRRTRRSRGRKVKSRRAR